MEEYLRLFILEDLKVIDDDEGRRTIAEINQAFKEAQIGRQVGRVDKQREAPRGGNIDFHKK